MTAPLSNFSSLLEIAFGLSALCGFVQNRLVRRLEDHENEISRMRAEYKEEEDDELFDKLDNVRKSFHNGLHSASDVIQCVILGLSLISIYLLFTSAVFPSFGFSVSVSIIIIGLMISIPIIITSIFSLVLDVRHARAMDSIRNLILDLEKKGLHVDGAMSLSRMGKLFGVKAMRRRGIANWLVRKLSGYRTVSLCIDEAKLPHLNDLRRWTAQNNEEVISSSLAFLSTLVENPDGFIVIERADGLVKKIPVESLLLTVTGEANFDQMMESVPWENFKKQEIQREIPVRARRND